jgi:hypothetical protein
MDKLLYFVSSELIPLVTGGVVLYYSIVAMKRIKWPGFRCWVWAGGLAIVGHLVLIVSRSGSTDLSASARHGFWVFWCVGYTVSALLGTYGTVSIIKHLLTNGASDSAHV